MKWNMFILVGLIFLGSHLSQARPSPLRVPTLEVLRDQIAESSNGRLIKAYQVFHVKNVDFESWKKMRKSLFYRVLIDGELVSFAGHGATLTEQITQISGQGSFQIDFALPESAIYSRGLERSKIELVLLYRSQEGELRASYFDMMESSGLKWTWDWIPGQND